MLVHVVNRATTAAQQAVLILLVLGLRQAATAEAHQPFINGLAGVVVKLSQAAATANQANRALKVNKVANVVHELHGQRLQLLRRQDQDVLLSLRLRKHANDSRTARRTAATAATAQNEVKLSQLRFRGVRNVLEQYQDFSLVRTLANVERGNSSAAHYGHTTRT